MNGRATGGPEGGAIYRSLLVPLDGSAFSEHSLPLAMSVARRTNAAIHLLHVGPPQSGPAQAREVPPDSYLGRLASRLTAHSADSRQVQTHPLLIHAGHIAVAICTAAERVGADLVVMSDWSEDHRD